MKANEVLKFLNVTRPTLSSYVKNGYIKAERTRTGYYDYDRESVFQFRNKEIDRINVIYSRVSTAKQKKDLENQTELLETYCNKNGIIIGQTFSDVGSGINFDRKAFQDLLHAVLNYKVKKVFITYKDRLSRISFPLFKDIFEKFGCEIVVLNETNDEKLIEKEIFSEIISLIHCFSMKVYSNRRKEKLKLMKKDLELEDETNV